MIILDSALRESFQALSQRGVTKVVPRGLSELSTPDWEPRETKKARVCGTQYLRGQRNIEGAP